MHCPECSQALKPMEYEGVEVHTCEGCGGEFLGAGELRHIVETREQRFDKPLLEELQENEPVFGVPDEEVEREVGCPACGVAMTPINYATDSGVCVDRCNQCGGLWLDRMELEKVQALLERWSDEAPARFQAIAGDLEQSRRRMAEQTSNTFAGSRFAFVNAVINRLLDAA